MSTQDNFPKIRILDIDIDIVSIDQAVGFIVEAARKGPARYISKPYVEFFSDYSKNQSQDSPRRKLTNLLNDAYICLPEGVAVQWAAYYQSGKGGVWRLFKSLFQIVVSPSRTQSVIPEKFGGTNFTWPLLEAAAKEKLSVYLVGSPVKNDIDHTARHLKDSIDGLKIVGKKPGRDNESGTFSSRLEAELVKDLKRKNPDIILIGIGFPRQEFLARRLADELDHGVFIGEGGTFDYHRFGGKFRKAPKPLQAVGLEWLWRLALEPKRVKRHVAIPKFIRHIYKSHPRRHNR